MKLSQRTVLVGLILASALLSYGWYRIRHTSPNVLTAQQRSEALAQGAVEYTSILFTYSVILPGAWPIEDISQPLVAFFGPDQNLKSGNEQAVYEGGAVSLQVVSPTFKTNDALLAFVRTSIEPTLHKLGVEFTGKPKKIDGYDGYRISVTKPYPLTQLVVNGPVAVRLVFQQEPKQLDRLLTTLQHTTDLSGDRQTVVRLTDQFLSDAKDGKAQALYAQASASFRSKISEEQFAAQLKAGKAQFGFQHVLVSLLLSKDTATVRGVLLDKTHAKMNRVTLIFARDGDTFTVDGLTVSDTEESSFGNLNLK